MLISSAARFNMRKTVRLKTRIMSVRCAGRDPKPFPPPMKLCKEMVDAMGGANAGPYRRFRSMACEAYNILRKNAGLILSLVHLMAGASITDIRLDPEKALLKLQARPGSA